MDAASDNKGFFDITAKGVFASYAFYAAILAIKLFAVTFLTAYQRYRTKSFANPEDARLRNAEVTLDNPDVERVRRAHLNDLENIPIFLAIAFLYTLTNPDVTVAENLFRVFTVARIVHTIVYAVVPVRQPARAIAFFLGLLITVYMAIMVIITAAHSI